MAMRIIRSLPKVCQYRIPRWGNEFITDNNTAQRKAKKEEREKRKREAKERADRAEIERQEQLAQEEAKYQQDRQGHGSV